MCKDWQIRKRVPTSPISLPRRSFPSPPRLDAHALRAYSTQISRHASWSPSSKASQTTSTGLPHLNAVSEVHMVPIGAKSASARRAVAVAHVAFSRPETLNLVQTHALRKGDVLAVARVAGVMAVKRTPDLVPLCHPGIAIEGVHVSVRPAPAEHSSETHEGQRTGAAGEGLVGSQGHSEGRLEREVMRPLGPHGGVRIAVEVECSGKTGVEMEALAGVVGAALTVVDMCKGADRGMVVGGAQVVRKEGGRSGTWTAERWG